MINGLGQSVLQITCPLNITVSYLIILALSSSGRVQFKGLFDQASLSLPLSLRVVRGVCGAIALIPTGIINTMLFQSCFTVSVSHMDAEDEKVAHII